MRAGVTAAIWLVLVMIAAAGGAAAQPAAGGAAPAAAPVAEEAVPPQVEDLRRLLADPVLRAWLDARTPAAAEVTGPAAVEEPGPATVEDGASGLGAAAARLSAHRAMLLAGVPAAPGALAASAARLWAEMRAEGLLLSLLLVIGPIAAGIVAEWRFVRVTRTLRKSVLGRSEESVPERLRKLGLRLALGAGAVAVFGAVAFGALAVTGPPPLLQAVAAVLLIATTAYRLAARLIAILLAPGTGERRVVPMSEVWARFWDLRLRRFAGLFAVGWAVAIALRDLGTALPTPLLTAYAFGLGLLALALEAIWARRRLRAAEDGATGIVPAAGWSLWAASLFGLWLTGATKLFWFFALAALLPMAIAAVNRAVNHLLRPIPVAAPDPEVEAEAEAPPSVLAAVVERGARAALIAGAGAALLWAWDLDVGGLLSGEGPEAVVARLVINLALIAVVFDFVWHVARTAIDVWVAAAAVPEGQPALDPDEIRRRARLRTLLPILRNLLQVVLATTAVLMGLASLGVQIGPLIAGAGVVGVAVGFGAQSVVKDVIAGVFYLLDDAFRVGEYVVAGSYKGTVENFSLRSIKLRHHRGPLYTIPFGSLGAIQNMSREWVIEKLSLMVPFDTDVAKLKKVIKVVSKELMEDPELAPGFIEPLKSQGADAIGDHGLRVVIKFKAIPGKQFAIRRRANAAIQKAFAANGIDFAFPTVRVAGEGAGQEAVAAAAMARTAQTAAG